MMATLLLPALNPKVEYCGLKSLPYCDQEKQEGNFNLTNSLKRYGYKFDYFNLYLILLY